MKKMIVTLAMVALLLLVAGCDAEGRQFIIDLALDWARANAVDVGAYTLFGRSGNAEVDAVLGARDVIANINAADKLMEEGRRENDLEKMDQAVEKRPGDYTYRVSYGTALLQGGRTSDAEAQFEAANAAAQNYGEAHVQRYATQGIDELGALRPGFEANGFADAEQCRAYNNQMAHFYAVRYAGTGETFFRDQQSHYLELAQACR